MVNVGISHCTPSVRTTYPRPKVLSPVASRSRLAYPSQLGLAFRKLLLIEVFHLAG